MPRKCSLCPTLDRPSVSENARCNCSGGEVEGHTADCQKIEHYVQLDIKLLTGVLTKKLRKQGWVERPQGFRNAGGSPQPAIERFICGPCAAIQDSIGDIAQFVKKIQDESDPDKVPTMYQILSS